MTPALSRDMPYITNDDLPIAVRSHLPIRAQDIYRRAFNAAFEQYGQQEEAVAHRVAWAAVKRIYKKQDDGVWVKAAVVRSGAGRRRAPAGS